MTVLRFGAIFNQILPAILHSFEKSANKISLLEPLVMTLGMIAVVAHLDGQLDMAAEREPQLKDWLIAD